MSHETQIPFYEQRIEKIFADDLAILAASQARKLFADRTGPNEIFINLGKAYFEAFQPALHQIANNSCLTIASGSSGRRLSELHDWLYGDKSHLLTDVQRSSVEREATFKGVFVRANEIDVRTLVQEGMANGEAESIQNYQSWFAPIGDLKVSPKWIVSKLAGFPVGTFHSDQARTVLRKLGIKVRRL